MTEGLRRRLDAGAAFGTGPDYDAPGSRLPALAMTRVKLLDDRADRPSQPRGPAIPILPRGSVPDVGTPEPSDAGPA